MTDTLAALVYPGMTVETPLWDKDRAQRCRAVVESVTPVGERLRIEYRYPSGYQSFQMLRPHDRIPVPEGTEVLETSDDPNVGTG